MVRVKPGTSRYFDFCKKHYRTVFLQEICVTLLHFVGEIDFGCLKIFHVYVFAPIFFITAKKCLFML